MPIKVVILAAAALVFAPGWQATDAAPKRPSGAELAGRILAPTFDEASRGSQMDRATKRVDRATLHTVPPPLVAWRVSNAELSLPDALWVSLLAPLLVAVAVFVATRAPRGPPHLPTS